MNVSLTNTSDLTATLAIDIAEADYSEKVETALADYRKKAVVPGFRKGKAPAGLIRKQYYKAITIDEVNKILQDALYNYLTEEKLDILGNALPVEQNDIDWMNQKDFTFEFELGLRPNIDIKLPKDAKLTYYKIVADEKMVDEYVADITKQYSNLSEPETAQAEDFFGGTAVEIDDDGNEVEHGVNKHIFFIGTDTADDFQEKLVALKKGEEIIINVQTDFSAEANVARILSITESELADLSTLRFTLNAISHQEPHPIDQELFDKALGEGKASNEAEFRAALKAQIESQYAGQSDSDLFHHAYHYYLDNVKFDLPEAFLKKWLQTAGDKPRTAEEVEAEFPKTLVGLRWQLIENEIIKIQNISVSREELEAYAKQLVTSQMLQYGQMLGDEQITQIAGNVLKNQEEVERINDQLYNQKLVAYFKDAFDLEEKQVLPDEFFAHQAEHKH